MAGGEGTMQLKIQGIAVSIALLFLTFAKRGSKKYAKNNSNGKDFKWYSYNFFNLINVLQLKL